jgi:hypothetical protein
LPDQFHRLSEDPEVLPALGLLHARGYAHRAVRTQ